ncbi:winged helix-turn-helix domain-containing protein [Thalassotalea sp. 1_MG-2023]|uniref:winged helix-turn-helix domain-containing protein n=1 Tax=Thalassotalea sp. 1_MG-2023 TaxID=3062680 RepID=UPI0026E3E2E0|nr:winged helix-turn-helix domain-containing protein [Thalassotalea sp. 1_MG-2023]MDO6425996.1 winged helix-turn-helix domain-containing protein [Thalassotalea sp. 1_MG-2023]
MNFQIGPWLFIPQKCILCSNSTNDIELEPILFKLLSYFVKHPHKIISRQELVENVWQQTFVDDNAINRAMSELRKKLSHPENVAPLIKTHYRKGYSITVEVIAISDENSSNNKATIETSNESNSEHLHITDNLSASVMQQRSRINYKHYRFMFFALISLVLLIVGYHIFTYFQATSTSETNINNHVKPAKASSKLSNEPVNKLPISHTIQGVTWNSGQELRPIVSSDNLLFAYNNRAEPKINSFVKRKGDLKEVQLIYKDFDVTSISWQHESHKVLAEVTNYKDECFLGLFDLTSFVDNPPVTKLKTCEKEIYGGAHLASNGKKLYLIELDQVKQGGQVVVYDVKTKKSTLLIPSGDTQFGVTNLKLSPDNKKLLYQRHQRDQPLSVHIMDLTTRDNNKLYQIPHTGVPLVFDWFPDSQHIAVQIARELTIFNVSGDNVSSYPININNWVVGLAVEDTSNILLAMATGQNLEVVNISELFNQQKTVNVTSLVKSDSMNYYATTQLDNTKSRYFISSRTGNLQIWRKQGQQVKQISAFSQKKPKKIGSLVLSPDQEHLLYLRGEHLETFNVKTNAVQTVEMPTHGAIGSYQWQEDQQKIYYDMEHDGIRQIWSTNLTTNAQHQLTQDGGKMLLKDEHQQIYYINDNHLHRLNGQSKHKITIPIAQCWCSVSLTTEALYSLDSNNLYKMTLNSGEVSSTTIPFRTSGFKMDSNHSAIAAKYNNAPSQIKRITWQKPLLNAAK